MKPSPMLRCAVITTFALLTPLSATGNSASSQRLSFDVEEGLNLNSFLRDGTTAAHLLLRSGFDPRILVAFPAGNSGVGLWFSHTSGPVTWALNGRPQPVTDKDERGRTLYGMSADAILSGVADVSIQQALLSSVRVLRDYQSLGTFPAEVAAKPVIQNSTITWARDRLDGASGYRLSVEVTQGKLEGDHISRGSAAGIGLKIIALSGEKPMTPLSGPDLLNAYAAPDPAARNVLNFLSYQEKFTAGSWRFNTYFGRDTLMSVRLLMPVLTPQAVQAGLGAVLTRLSPQGEVAHEEDIGEFAILDHLKESGVKSDAPTFNFNMIDGSFMLAPVAAEWLLNDSRGHAHARQFLAHIDQRYGEAPRAFGADLVSNLKFVLQAATKFAHDPRAQNLISLKPGFSAGQWRDSNDGLGDGRFPYDVNVVFVPAAIESAHRLFASGLLTPYLTDAEREIFSQAANMANIWSDQAGRLFDVIVPNATARQDIAQYAADLRISDEAALRSLDGADVRFHALALTADGKAIPIVHSDEGFELLFGHPEPADLQEALTPLMRPFPAGLVTEVGVVVANPVFAGAGIQARLTNNAYHGTVIWSWQQAVLAAGVQRQLQRPDLSAASRTLLRDAQIELWKAIGSGHALRNSELWSWSFSQGHFRVAAFGASSGDADESNAAQLWSTVYLAIPDLHRTDPARP
jgi:hypothetical protein